MVFHQSLLRRNLYFNDGDWVTEDPVNAATLLTGDIPLKGLSLPSAIELDKVRVFQLPHHGAHTFWDDRILKALPKNVSAVINFGLGNRNKHPSSLTISRLTKDFSSWKIVLNHQLSPFSYYIIYDLL